MLSKRAPLAPSAEEPVFKVTLPLTPADPLSTEAMLTDPLLLAELPPLSMLTSPPLPCTLEPADTVTLPPVPEALAPTLRLMEPPDRAPAPEARYVSARKNEDVACLLQHSERYAAAALWKDGDGEYGPV